MATKKETYTEAMKRLEAIVSQIESNELDIDELANRLKEAQRLIKYCRDSTKPMRRLKKCSKKGKMMKKTPNELDIVNINRIFAFVLPQRTQSHTEEYFYV